MNLFESAPSTGTRKPINGRVQLDMLTVEPAKQILTAVNNDTDTYGEAVTTMRTDPDALKFILSIAPYDVTDKSWADGVSPEDVERLYKTHASTKSHLTKKTLTENAFLGYIQSHIALDYVKEVKGTKRGTHKRAVTVDSAEQAVEVYVTWKALNSRYKSLQSARSKYKTTTQDPDDAQLAAMDSQIAIIKEALVIASVQEETRKATISEFLTEDVSSLTKAQLLELIEKTQEAIQ